MPHQRRDPDISAARRRVLDNARSRYERLTTAVIRWGRAREAGDADALRAAEEELASLHRELDPSRDQTGA